MTDTSPCRACGEKLSLDDVYCPACGTRRPDSDLAAPLTMGATRVFAPSAAEAAGNIPLCPNCRAPHHVASRFCTQCGRSLQPEPADAWTDVRRQLEQATTGDFEIVRELGRGGMAAVYVAKDLSLGRNVAIKVMAPGLLMGEGMVARFRQEAVTVASLLHPNIVTIHAVRQAGNLHFFIMQLVQGGSLDAVLKRTGVLTDFGIAKAATATHLTQTGSTLGTPSYMSPEQCLARELSAASDQCSLGVVGYEMLVGRPPFTGSAFEIMQAHTMGTVPGFLADRPDCPAEIEAAVLRMLARDPTQRFPSVAEAIEAVGGYIPGPRCAAAAAQAEQDLGTAAGTKREELTEAGPQATVLGTRGKRTEHAARAYHRHQLVEAWPAHANVFAHACQDWFATTGSAGSLP